jgi:hypothetical protein
MGRQFRLAMRARQSTKERPRMILSPPISNSSSSRPSSSRRPSRMRRAAALQCAAGWASERGSRWALGWGHRYGSSAATAGLSSAAASVFECSSRAAASRSRATAAVRPCPVAHASRGMGSALRRGGNSNRSDIPERRGIREQVVFRSGSTALRSILRGNAAWRGTALRTAAFSQPGCCGSASVTRVSASFAFGGPNMSRLARRQPRSPQTIGRDGSSVARRASSPLIGC